MIAVGAVLIALLTAGYASRTEAKADLTQVSVSSPASAASVAAGRPLTAQDAEAWLDGYMRFALPRSGIPGGVVVIVKDGKPLLEKGYGLADEARATPVDPTKTLFRVGSVSKLFTWTAVMQLAERGKIDLDADVNTYLDFTIPPFKGRPVTMRNLMTHTAGFEDVHRGLATDDPTEIAALGDALKRDMPARVYPPGTTPAYSNYAAALAGYIVQRISGEPFDAYIARHIFAPLGMRHSTFDEPLPTAMQADMAKGYGRSGAPASPYELVVWKPAGSLATTADDMSRFMIAQLHAGALILSPATARRMQNTPLTLIPPLNGMELGFYEKSIGGRRIIGHDGDTVLFHSVLALYPGQDVGLFAAFNSPGVEGASYRVRQQLLEGFTDRYFPSAEPPDGAIPLSEAQAHARMFAGAYLNSRASHSTFLAALGLLGGVRVIPRADGTISLSNVKAPDGALARFREVQPFVWREIGGHDRVAAIVSNGRVARLSFDEVSPIMVFDAAPVWRSPAVLAPAAGLAVVLVLGLVIFWPVRAAVRRYAGRPFPYSGSRAAAHRALHVTATLAIAAILGWAWLFLKISQPTGIYLLSKSALFIDLVEVLTLIGFVGFALAAGVNLAIVCTRSASWLSRTAGPLLLLAASVLLYVGFIYNLVKISARF